MRESLLTLVLSAVVSLTLFLALVGGQGSETCIGSSCKTYQDVNTLWCYSDPYHFCQCRTQAAGDPWTEQVMPCAEGTKFSFRHQVCVLAANWNSSDCFTTPLEALEPVQDGPCVQSCVTYAQIIKLVCHPTNIRSFCQCRPTDVPKVFTTIQMPCANGTMFSYQRQTCISYLLWSDSCPS